MRQTYVFLLGSLFYGYNSTIYVFFMFNRSEHHPVKGESAGSSPVFPDGFNKYIHLSIFCERGAGSIISFPTGDLFFFLFCFAFLIKGAESHLTVRKGDFFITSTSTDWWERDICGLVQFIIYWHIQDSKRDWVWFFNPIHVCNGIEYLISFYREHIHKWNSFLVRYKMNFTQLHYP